MPHNPIPEPGTTPQENFEWVLHFLRVDIQQLSIDELAGVLLNVRALARLAIVDPEREFEKWVVHPDAKLYRAMPGVHVRRETKLREDLVRYQNALKDRIRELTTRGITIVHISVPFNSKQRPYPAQMSFEIVRNKHQVHPVLFVNEGNPDEVFRAFEFRLMSVLQACADSIGLCPGTVKVNPTDKSVTAPRKACGKVFLKTRSDRDYCSETCGGVERARAWRSERKKKRTGLSKAVPAQQKGRHHGGKKK